MSELTMIRNDSFSFTVTVLDGAGAALDLTGKTLRVTLVRQPLADVTIVKNTGTGILHQTQSGATLGKATVTLDPADTSTCPDFPVAYRGDVQLTSGGLPYTTEPIWLRVDRDYSA